MKSEDGLKEADITLIVFKEPEEEDLDDLLTNAIRELYELATRGELTARKFIEDTIQDGYRELSQKTIEILEKYNREVLNKGYR